MYLLDLDRWLEIFANIRKNKLRTGLTAFGIFWGIFMLIIMLGAGNGLQNGVWKSFSGDALNMVWVWAWKTSMPYQGMQPGRQIRLTEEDFEVLKNNLPGLDDITAVNNLNGEFSIHHGDKSASFQIRACHTHYGITENLRLTAGRFISEADIREKRTITVMGKLAIEALFGDAEANVIGKEILIKGYPFKIVGTFTDNGGEHENRRAFIPFSTHQLYFAHGNYVENFALTLKGEQNPEEVETKIRSILSGRHSCNPNDKSAIGVWAASEEFKKVTGLFLGISAFIWVVGIGTLVAGIVGVGNVMLITVKERTKEIGIRKALGATPFWIVTFILQEAVFITTVAGYLGIVAGVFALELVRSLKIESEYFSNPEVDLSIAITAAIILVVAGALAGLLPALKAARIQPIEALRYE